MVDQLLLQEPTAVQALLQVATAVQHQLQSATATQAPWAQEVTDAPWLLLHQWPQYQLKQLP